LFEKASFLRVFDGVVWGYLKAACILLMEVQAAFYFQVAFQTAFQAT